MSAPNRDIRLTLILSGALLFAIWLDIVLLRIILALPLLFFLTGHLTLRVIGTTFSPVDHAVAAVGMSMAICIVGCFVLYGFDALTPAGWTTGLIFVLSALSAWIIGWRLPGGLVIRRPVLRLSHASIIISAAAIVVSAYSLAIHDEATTRQFAYTEFWMVPVKSTKFILGVKNQEFQPQTYDVSVATKDSVLMELHSIHLDPGEVWTREINSRERAEATLFLRQNGQRVKYRRVSGVPNTPIEKAADAQ